MVAIRFFTVALAAVTVSAVTYQDVLNDLTQLDTDTKTLTSSTNSYTGTGAQTLTLRNQEKTVENDITKATSDTNSATAPTAAQGTSVYNYVAGTLLTDTKAALTATVNKKSTFTSAGVIAEICTDVKNLKSLTDKLAAALIAKAPNSDLKTKGQTTQGNYDTAFNNAISGLGC